MPFGLPNLEQKISKLIEGNSGITAIREIEWDRKYLWLVQFIDAGLPEPFDGMFPASAVSFQLANLESDSFRFGQSELMLPVRAGSAKQISLTFYDDIDRTLSRWCTDWINLDILNNGQFVSCLKDSHKVVTEDSFGNSQRPVQPVKKLKISLVDGYRKELKETSWLFDVYITGEIEWSGSQDSAPQEYTVNLVIVGDSGKTKSSDSNAIVDTLRDVLGRII